MDSVPKNDSDLGVPGGGDEAEDEPIRFHFDAESAKRYFGFRPYDAAAEAERYRQKREHEAKRRLDAEQREREREERQAKLVAKELRLLARWQLPESEYPGDIAMVEALGIDAEPRIGVRVPLDAVEAELVKPKRRSTNGPGRPPKQPTYRRYCELWCEHRAGYEPGFRQSISATERSFLSWLRDKYLREWVGRTKLGELKGEWKIRGWAFPPTDC